MKLNEVLKEVADPGPHPEVNWPKFVKTFNAYVLKNLVYPDRETRRDAQEQIETLMYSTDAFYDVSIDDVRNSFDKDNIDELHDNIITALIKTTYAIINSDRLAIYGLKSTIDHTDSIPLPWKDLKALVEAGCPGLTSWTHQKHNYEHYLSKKKHMETSAGMMHLIADIKHEVMHHFQHAMKLKLASLKKDRHPQDNWAFEQVTLGEVAKFTNYLSMLSWLDTRNKAPKERAILYKAMFEWVIGSTSFDFAKNDPEVSQAAHHAKWNDDAFLKKVLKALAPFFEKELKDAAAHGH